MKPVAFTSGQFEGRFTYIPNNPAVVLPNGMALYSEPSAMLLEAVRELGSMIEYLAVAGCDGAYANEIAHAEAVLEKLK